MHLLFFESRNKYFRKGKKQFLKNLLSFILRTFYISRAIILMSLSNTCNRRRIELGKIWEDAIKDFIIILKWALVTALGVMEATKSLPPLWVWQVCHTSESCRESFKISRFLCCCSIVRQTSSIVIIALPLQC